ncbi:hypothetical protein F5Y05DRAFT_265494 [Hypoxylon sp. FL0543]|nr:hypothetical protein F5Y05DRAFT_265494 [Hypoxylon sp. FL0543]
MRRWSLVRSSIFEGLRGHKPRRFSVVVNDVERVSVRNGSSGFVTIDLHNIAKVSSPDPLLIYLPPYSTAFADRPAQVPRFLQRRPVAVINYRWAGLNPLETEELPSSKSNEQSEEDELPHLSWPTPIHDTARAYDWIIENLSPSTSTRRNIYVYGSYLGASLATSLALTETHPHARMGIRGVVAYNGIYNWTMFLPDHPINNPPKQRSMSIFEEILAHSGDPKFQDMKRHAEALFGRPDNIFDPFASPCLFFQTPGLLVPPSFDASALPPPGTSILDLSTDPEDVSQQLLTPLRHPRRSPLVFPPRKSTLKIPETLLLHSPPPPLPPSLLRRRLRRKKSHAGNSFRYQAEQLAGLMRRSLDKFELKERSKWDDDFESWHDEAARRVQVSDGGLSTDAYGLGVKGEGLAAAWLEDHIQ